MGRAKRLHQARKNAKKVVSIKAVVHTDYEEWEEHREHPGHIYFTAAEGIPQSIFISCPGCGQPSAMDISNPTVPHERKLEGAKWVMRSRDPVTLHPSVHHTKERGGCGWHGWLRNGIWKG